MREDWIESSLGEVCKITLGQSPLSTDCNNQKIGLPFFQGKAEFTSKYPIPRVWCAKPKKIANADSILLSVRAPVGSTNVAFEKCGIGRGLAALEYDLCQDFILFYLKAIEQELDSKGTGTTFRAISGDILRNQKIPLPPLVEQRAIVKKLESLFSSLDAGVADLKKAQQQLKIYRQAVLKKAFEGELTKEWRSKQNYLPSSDEISRLITDERAIFYKIQLDEWEKEVEKWKETTTHKKPTRPSKFSNPDLPTSEQESDKWSIPNGWIWTQVGEICFVTKLAGFEYSDYVKYTDDGDLPVLKAENVGNNGFKPTIYSKVDFNSVSMLKRTYLNGGELLVVFVGAGTGKVGLVPYNKKFFLGPNIGMARPYFKLNGKYLEYFYQCLLGKKLLMATVKAVAQPSLSMGSIRQSPFVMCSLEEQNEIVKQIESRLSVCDSIEQNIKEGLKKAEALRQSILKKAFEGNLLTAQELAACKQAADYEPASVLLQRIRNEKLKIRKK